jgi:hypothetical protein
VGLITWEVLSQRETRERQRVTPEFGRHLEKKFYTTKFRVLQCSGYVWAAGLSILRQSSMAEFG